MLSDSPRLLPLATEPTPTRGVRSGWAWVALAGVAFAGLGWLMAATSGPGFEGLGQAILMSGSIMALLIFTGIGAVIHCAAGPRDAGFGASGP